jgi:hypothetical protein
VDATVALTWPVLADTAMSLCWPAAVPDGIVTGPVNVPLMCPPCYAARPVPVASDGSTTGDGLKKFGPTAANVRPQQSAEARQP